ncbi:MAG TPA: molybdate ABC transporter substrate-binding protein [Candidatus Limnocylindrales bacterium]|nr:molybdate ABC transporter substrate-binding protein [Candidatus Limnocylindrales bacterium]
MTRPFSAHRAGGARVLAAATLLAVAVGAGCGPSGSSAPTPVAELTVLAAASLREPLDALAAALLAEANVALAIATGSSTALRVQIEQGAPADVFLAADATNPDRLVGAGLTSGVPTVFARNHLAIVVPAGNPAGISVPWDLGRPGLRIVGAGDAVPISQYAMLLVEGLAGLPGAPADYAAAYEANVVSREDDVGAVLAKVELGEADAAIVYASDAAGSDLVESVPVPDEVQVDVAYAGVVIATSRQQPLAHGFLGWLGEPVAREILAGFGFRAGP